MSLAANTVTGTLTSVTSASVFRDSGRGEADDTFGAGTIQFTGGANAGLKPLEVKSFSGGTITTFEPFYYLPIGRRHVQHGAWLPQASGRLSKPLERITTYSNVANFGGDLWIPSGSTYATVGQGG